MSYIFWKLCDQGRSWHWKNDVRSWFKATRNFFFTLDSNRTLIWHCLISSKKNLLGIFCKVLRPVSFYSAGPEVQEYFTAYLRVALYALSKVISFSTSSLFCFFFLKFIAFSGNENADLLSNELQFMHTPRWLSRRYNQTRQIGAKYVLENCMPWFVITHCYC